MWKGWNGIGKRHRKHLCALAGAALLGLSSGSASASDPAKQVDMLLCLAADVSESVTRSEFDLQREGHAAAIRDSEVMMAIQGGATGRIAMLYAEWARQDQQHLAVDWTMIDSPETAEAFAARIDEADLPPWIEAPVRNTSTGEAIRYCLAQFENAPFEAERRVIDISSDGTSNIGADILKVRGEALARGVTINVLAIANSDNPFTHPTHESPRGGLKKYFRENVVGGSGAFVEIADGYESFSRMIRRKFLLELAVLKNDTTATR